MSVFLSRPQASHGERLWVGRSVPRKLYVLYARTYGGTWVLMDVYRTLREARADAYRYGSYKIVCYITWRCDGVTG